MLKARLLLAAALLASACASPAAPPAPSPATPRPAAYRPAELRQAALFVRVAFGPGTFAALEREAITTQYEGALLDALNGSGILVRDTRVTSSAQGTATPAAALMRAREVQADHAVLVEARIARQPEVFCRDTRRPLQTTATVWTQGVTILRASDGAARLTVMPDRARAVMDLEPDCEKPQESPRRSRDDLITEAAARLVRRLLSP
jgi:hypothetical protein